MKKGELKLLHFLFDDMLADYFKCVMRNGRMLVLKSTHSLMHKTKNIECLLIIKA